jgi:hypothetical protein
VNEKQEAIRRQLEELRAESDALKVEERAAHRQLAQMWKRYGAAMQAYRATLTRQNQSDTQKGIPHSIHSVVGVDMREARM